MKAYHNLNPALRRVVITGITAAIYAGLTVMLPFMSYGAIQCRLSEVLNLLAFINPVFAPGIILGCFIANLFSDFPLDIIFGTLATVLTMLCVTRSKSLFVASLWPTAFCFIIGGEITFAMGAPYLLSTFAFTTLTVMAGEFAAMTVIGYPLFRQLMKNQRFVGFLKGL